MEHSYGMLLDYIARIVKMEIRVQMFSFSDRYRNIGKYFLETEAKWFGVSQMMDLFLYDREGDERETWKDDKNFTSREFSFVDIYKLIKT